jgi:hypothetical protein
MRLSHAAGYSQRRAFIGSIRMARRAGKNAAARAVAETAATAATAAPASTGET